MPKAGYLPVTFHYLKEKVKVPIPFLCPQYRTQSRGTDISAQQKRQLLPFSATADTQTEV